MLMHTLLFSALFIFTSQSFAATKITVRKVKGKNAIVESQAPLEEGHTYDLADEIISEDVDYKTTVQKPRSNSFTVGTQFKFGKSDRIELTDFSLHGRYGWNYTTLEFGAILDFRSLDTGTGATSTLLAGGYYDYNLEVNRFPKKFVYGLMVLGAFGSTNYPSTTVGTNTTNIELDMGGFATYFLGNSSTALRGEGFFKYEQLNTSTQQNSLFGFGVRGLLVYYF